MPPAVSAEVASFFEENVRWLADVFSRAAHPKAYEAAEHAVSALEGAMIVASVTGNRGAFDSTARWVTGMLSG